MSHEKNHSQQENDKLFKGEGLWNIITRYWKKTAAKNFLQLERLCFV